MGYLACAIGSKYVQNTGNKWLCSRLSEIGKSFHLHNNEVGSEAISSVCLPPNCVHVLNGLCAPLFC